MKRSVTFGVGSSLLKRKKMTDNEILLLINFARSIKNSKIHIGIEIEGDKVYFTFVDSVSLDIITESLQDASYEKIKNILITYKDISEG